MVSVAQALLQHEICGIPSPVCCRHGLGFSTGVETVFGAAMLR